MDCTVHAILQARILEWVAFPFSRGSSQPKDQTQVSHIAGRFFTSWAVREAWDRGREGGKNEWKQENSSVCAMAMTYETKPGRLYKIVEKQF